MSYRSIYTKSDRDDNQLCLGDHVYCSDNLNNIIDGRITSINQQIFVDFICIDNTYYVPRDMLVKCNDSWVKAGELKENDIIYTLDTINKKIIYHVVYEVTPIKIFDDCNNCVILEVEPYHNYFYSGVLVHNGGPGTGSSAGSPGGPGGSPGGPGGPGRGAAPSSPGLAGGGPGRVVNTAGLIQQVLLTLTGASGQGYMITTFPTDTGSSITIGVKLFTFENGLLKSIGNEQTITILNYGECE